MKNSWIASLIVAAVFSGAAVCPAEAPPALRVGRAAHAFDHLGAIADQAATAAASGANVIYASGLGIWGYAGRPADREFAACRKAVVAYNKAAREAGVDMIIGYLCATSIVRLDGFDQHWSDEFRRNFNTPPSAWRQVGRDGQPLPSWYGGDYQPACMNHPDWRTYEQLMVREQLDAGHDGIFFDNPTVHPQGCYCTHCMDKFATHLATRGVIGPDEKPVGDDRLESIRRLADQHPEEFRRFRCTIAPDFLQSMRAFARSVNPQALVTCNNSLNSPQVFYSQCRDYGYNIEEMSRIEDLVVVEDMGAQPRAVGAGQFVEYGPMYEQLRAIAHGKPIIAVTIADGDYHTPPHLVRLAMAEAAAHGASYLSWPTWPEPERSRMIAAIRPQAGLLRRSEALLNATPRADVIVYMPFQRWATVDHCATTEIAAALTRANVPYIVVAEDGLAKAVNANPRSALLVDALPDLSRQEQAIVDGFQRGGGRVFAAGSPETLTQAIDAIGRTSLSVDGPLGVRAVVSDQSARTIVHLLNLNIAKLSSLEDQVTPAADVRVSVRVPFHKVNSVRLQSADEGATMGDVPFTSQVEGDGAIVKFHVPLLAISAIASIEGH